MAKYLTKSWLSGNKCMLFISSQVELFSEVFNKWLTSVWIQALMVSSWMNISAALAKSTGASAEIIWVDVHEKRAPYQLQHLTTYFHILIQLHNLLYPGQRQFLVLEIRNGHISYFWGTPKVRRSSDKSILYRWWLLARSCHKPAEPLW